jgi:nicotinamide-nucleotide amidase
MKNPNGTAVGLIFDKDKQVIVALPGPPRELRPMVENELIPYLLERYGIRSTGASITMRFVGIGESAIDQVIDQLKLPENLIISSLFETGRVDLTLSLPGDAETGSNKLRALEKSLLEHIGEYMYSDSGESLEEHVVGLLKKKEITLSSVEVGTAGKITAALSSTIQSDGVVMGGFVAPNINTISEILKFTANDQDVPKPDSIVAGKLASKATKLTGSNWAVATLRGIPGGPGDNEVLWVVVSSSTKLLNKKSIRLNNRRARTPDYLVTQVLDFLRQTISSIER